MLLRRYGQMFFWTKRNVSTFLKYLVSYVLVFSVLMLCFFFVLRSQLEEAYESRQSDRVFAQMDAASAHLTSEITFLVQTDELLQGNADIRRANYLTDSKYWRAINQELEQYASASSLIRSIVYHARLSDHVFSTMEYVTQQDDIYRISKDGRKFILFDPRSYLGSNSGQLIWLENTDVEYLLWLPANQTDTRQLYFYVLDTSLIQSQLNTLLSNEVVAVGLLDSQGRCVTGSGFGPYESALQGTAMNPGARQLNDDYQLYVSRPIQDGFTLAAVVSGDVLQAQVSQAFVRSYFAMLGLSLVGIVLVCLAMSFTYKPLHALVTALGHSTGRHENYLDLIARQYLEMNSQKAQLEQTLAEYRESLAQLPEEGADNPPYPHEELGQLSLCLRENRFSDARNLVDTLLETHKEAPVYFLGCILLDCLTIITNSMNKARIEYEGYSEVFTEAVRQCRSIPQTQDYPKLQALLHELLFFYERETMDRLMHISPLRQIVAQHFCDPAFSISHIAEIYHVSDSRMSTLFKEELGISFTDCVWQLRLEKARELLRATRLSVDEISLQVGYLAPTSFSRKFKAETGMTPSQYRSSLSKGGESE